MRTPVGDTKIPEPIIDPTITVQPFTKLILAFNPTSPSPVSAPAPPPFSPFVHIAVLSSSPCPLTSRPFPFVDELFLDNGFFSAMSSPILGIFLSRSSVKFSKWIYFSILILSSFPFTCWSNITISDLNTHTHWKTNFKRPSLLPDTYTREGNREKKRTNWCIYFKLHCCCRCYRDYSVWQKQILCSTDNSKIRTNQITR